MNKFFKETKKKLEENGSRPENENRINKEPKNYLGGIL